MPRDVSCGMRSGCSFSVASATLGFGGGALVLFFFFKKVLFLGSSLVNRTDFAQEKETPLTYPSSRCMW